MEADEVVLPTPPLPDVTTSTCACAIGAPYCTSSVERRDEHHVAFEPGLDRLAAQFRFDVVSRAVEAADREQLGLDLAAEDASAFIAVGACEGAAAQRAVGVDRAAGDHFRAGGDRAEHGDVAMRKDNAL